MTNPDFLTALRTLEAAKIAINDAATAQPLNVEEFSAVEEAYLNARETFDVAFLAMTGATADRIHKALS